MKMKIALVGHYIDKPEEGVRNVANYLQQQFKKNDISHKCFNISDYRIYLAVKKFRPDIIHFILSPTVYGLASTRLISMFAPEAKTVVSALHPDIPNLKIIKYIQPDLILVQSNESETLLEDIGLKTCFFPNGVDLFKFRPASGIEKVQLRYKYNVPQDKFIVLHLASMTKGRNLDIFEKIQQERGTQVLIVGRNSEPADSEVLDKLLKEGCLVLKKYYPDIEELYRLSDCYVFPTVEHKACIETPLSVLEAMACNLPIISTKFGALPRLFNSRPYNFHYVDDDIDYLNAISLIKHSRSECETRQMVSKFSWDSMLADLVKIYKEL